jgi:hypothetical protein
MSNITYNIDLLNEVMSSGSVFDEYVENHFSYNCGQCSNFCAGDCNGDCAVGCGGGCIDSCD